VKHNKQIGREAILKNCNMTFKSKSTFTEKIWNTYLCSIIFSIPISYLPKIEPEAINLLKKYSEDLLLPGGSGFRWISFRSGCSSA
jgi:hypothetical protein